MFAEEQAGNPAKKRADEAKARRLRAKRELEAKEQRKRNELERRERAVATIKVEVEGGTASDLEVNKDAAASVVAKISSTHFLSESQSAKPSRQCDSVEYAKPIHLSASSEVLTATQKAAEQRKVRAEARARVSAATLIQSIVRSKIVSMKTREDQRRVFDKRMADLNALSSILKQSTKADYIPPPATVSIMTTQFLFFACPIYIRSQSPGELTLDSGSMIIDEREIFRWVNLVKNLLTPGVSGDNLDLDPLIPWMETVEGRRRLRKVLHLCISSISRKHIPHSKREFKGPNNTTSLTGDKKSSIEQCCSSVDLFLRIILGLSRQYSGEQRSVIYKTSYSLLMQRTSPAECRSTCDIISSLRSALLFGPTRTNPPIPGDAGRLREKCVMTVDKEMASMLLKLVLDFIASLDEVGTDQMFVNLLCSRFVCEVMTVPLLTWKCWPSSYERLLRLISSDNLNEKINPTPPLVIFLHRFIKMHADLVSEGRIDAVLQMPDVSLTTCPATGVLCLLANLVQIGKACEELNGMNPPVIHYNAAAEYFNFLSILVNAAPLGTFCSRMSAVEWVSCGSSTKPIVISDVVCEQVSSVLSDSYVRALFTCAINDDKLDEKNVLNTKTDKDEKHEKDLADIGMSSAASIAAKEARIDRNRSIWQSSKWAKQLSALISGPREKKFLASKVTDSRGVGKLMNTSSISRQLANGQGPIKIPATSVLSSHDATVGETKDPPRPRHEYSIFFLLSLCRFYGTVISRWGGQGKEDLVRRGRNLKENSMVAKDTAVASVEPCVTALLNVLCFSTSFLTSSWAIIQSNPRVVADLYDVIDVNKRTAPIRTLTAHQSYRHLQNSQYGVADGNVGALVLLMFVTCLSHTLIVTDDVEIHDFEKPLPKHQLRRCIVLIKKLLYRACCLDDVHELTKSGVSNISNHVGLALISSSSKLQNELYTRSSRRLLCAPKLWIEEGLLEEDLRKCRTHSEYVSLLSTPVCRLCPFLISFKRRLKLFERIVTTNREDIQGSNAQRNLKPGIMVKVMRGRVLEDGLAHLNKLGRDMRQRIVISYISEAGARETGIDVGGLFKEFWSDLSNLAFDPNYALFKNTEGFLMYPNPTSKLAHGSDHIILFEFLGRILGKALYEGITIQPQFAHLFLSFLRGDHNYLHLLTDLSTIDPQLYGNLMFLKNYGGDVSDLCLTFTVSHDDFGVQEVPLIAGGEDIEVTNENKRRYIYLVAKHHVSDRIKEQSDAFTRGLWDVIDSSWLRLFNEPELQVLISGASDGKIDVTDMKSNTRYTGGYTRLDRNVVRFWNVVTSLSPKHQADLLRFVTSCERPPPLGFGSMNPPFTIQRVGIMRDADKLPTASTCFNTLKLPTYSSEKVLREKLLYSIGAGAGFELT